MTAGKGDAPRPFSVSKEEFDNNFDIIFKKKVNDIEEDLLKPITERIENILDEHKEPTSIGSSLIEDQKNVPD